MAGRTWEDIETRACGRIMCRVSSRVGEHDGSTLYSMRVGTAHVHEDGETRISVYMSIYDIDDAIALLQEVSERYKAKRAQERQARSRY